MVKVAFRALVICFVLIAFVHTSEAGNRSFGIDPYTAFPGSGAYYSYAGGVVLPDVQYFGRDPEFTIRFMLPESYKPNGFVRITYYYMPVHGTTSCGDFVLFNRNGGRFQPGSEGHAQGTLNIAPRNGENILPTEDATVKLKTYTFRPANGNTLKPGDYIFATFTRDVTSVDDSCTDDLFVVGMRVTHQTRSRD